MYEVEAEWFVMTKNKLCSVGLLREMVNVTMYLCSRFGKEYGMMKKQL